MQVQVNVKAAAKRIKKFIEAAGGTTAHSDVLELVSEVCGFDSYRALQAASTKVAKSSAVSVPAATPSQDGRPLESASSVVFATTAVDWQVAGNPGISFDMVPRESRGVYDFIVEQDGSQFRVLMKPVGVNLDNFPGRAVLDMMVEINEGLPCVHMTNNPADEMLATVFATGHGLLIRQDGGEWMRGDSVDAPEAFSSLLDDLGSNDHEVHLAVLDTAEKYRDDEVTLPDVVTATPAVVVPDPVIVLRSFVSARTDLVHPVRRQHVGAYVEVRYENAGKASQLLPVWVRLFDAEGVCGDEDALLLLTRFTSSTPDAHFKKLADNLAQLAAFFIEGGYDTGDISLILERITAHDDAQDVAERKWNVAFNEDDRASAYVALTASLL